MPYVVQKIEGTYYQVKNVNTGHIHGQFSSFDLAIKQRQILDDYERQAIGQNRLKQKGKSIAYKRDKKGRVVVKLDYV